MIAQVVAQKEQLLQAVQKEFLGVWEEVLQAKDGEAAERRVQEWSRQLGRRVLEEALQEAIERKEAADKICCGRPMLRRVRERRQVLTLLGAVRVRRRYLLCPRCQRHARPADDWLGWPGGFSPAVEELVAWECAALPYREALASLKKLAGLELSVLAAERIVARWGKSRLPLAPYAERVAKDLVVEIDGAMAHLEEGWKEIKVGACVAWDRDRAEREPGAVSYCADWETAEQFCKTLWKEALARGAPDAAAIAVIGDGAPWVWEIASLLFPRATQILDWYHLTEHLWEAAKAVHGEGGAETKALEKWWETEIWEGRSELVEGYLRELVAAKRDDGNNTLRRCADYLQTHQARLRYHLFRAAGWPLGSGIVEGACKHVVGLRFKRQSTRWTRAGARNVLHLRLDRLSNRWEKRCRLVRNSQAGLPMAA